MLHMSSGLATWVVSVFGFMPVLESSPSREEPATRLREATSPAGVESPCVPSRDLCRLVAAMSGPFTSKGVRSEARPTVETEKITDAGVRQLADLAAYVRELELAQVEAAREVKAATGVSATVFTARAFERLAKALRDRDDAPPLGLIGDVYSAQSAVLPFWHKEVALRHACRSVSNSFAEQLRAHVEKRCGAPDPMPAQPVFRFEFVEGDERRGHVRIHNRGAASATDCIVLAQTSPDPERTTSIEVIEDFGLLAVLCGADPREVLDRKALNAAAVAYANTAQTLVFFVPEIPAQGCVEFLPCDSVRTLFMARTCELTIWSANAGSMIAKVPGLSRIQPEPPALVARRTRATALIAEARKLMESDPRGAFERLTEARKLVPGNAQLGNECTRAHDDIVESLRARRKENEDAWKAAKRERERLEPLLANDRQNESLKRQFDEVRERIETLRKEGDKIRGLLELR